MRVTEDLIRSFKDKVEASDPHESSWSLYEGLMEDSTVGVHDLDTVMHLFSLVPKIRKGNRRLVNAVGGGAL